MKDLEKFNQIEKQLNAKKRENLKKAYEVLGRKFYKKSHAKNLPKAEEMIESMSKYEKLGREFYQKSNAKSMSEAEEMLTNMPLDQVPTTLTEKQFSQLKFIADSMQWTGKYWSIDNLPEISNWLSQFRKKENEQ